MHIAILGGGYTGLTAAYELTRRGHTVTIFEKEPVLGGLAVGFKAEGWEWPLERAYHHLFASDADILAFAKDIGFPDVFFRTPHTDSLYAADVLSSPDMKGFRAGNDYRIFPVDTPHDFLQFPLLPLADRIRAAAVLGFLRYSPFLPFFEQITAVEFIKKSMGERVWKIWWEQLFRKKFGKYAENILLAWFWSRISKRTRQLGYIKGGFQTFVEFLEKKNREQGVQIKSGYAVTDIHKEGERFVITGQDGQKHTMDALISTLPTPILMKAGQQLLPPEYLNRLAQIQYLHALVLIIESQEKILEKRIG